MFPRGEIKKNLLATLEIGLFMRQGPDRFGNSFGEMLRSWTIFFIFLPLTYIALYYLQPTNPNFVKISYGFLSFLVTLKIAATTAIFLALLYGIARQYDRKHYFYMTITALNWAAIITCVLMLPGVIAVILGQYVWQDIFVFNVFLAIYAYALAAFIMTFTMRLPWELATFLAILSMMLDQASLQFLYWFLEYFF